MAVQCKRNRLGGWRGTAGEYCRGFNSVVSLQSGGHSRELLEEKSKSPLFPTGAGEGMVTNEWCIYVGVRN